MPLYGVAQAGGNQANPGLNLTALCPGEKMFLFNAEVVATGNASVAFNRGPAPALTDAGMTFSIDWGSAPTATVEIQGANTDTDGSYQTLYVSANLLHDNYTDTARWAYYRAKVTSYVAGETLTVKVQR